MTDDRFIAGLAALDTGGLARLRRCAGQRLAESSTVYAVFFRLIAGVPHREQDQEIYFLVATLYALTARGSDARRAGGGRSIGLALHTLRQEQLSAVGGDQGGTISLDRRVAALLDADAEQLPFRLRQIVRLVHSHEQTIDWSRFLKDVVYWTHPDRFVQQRWAREYYMGSSAQTLNDQKEALS